MFLKYLKHLFFISVVGYFIYTPLHYIEEINPLKKELSDFRFTDIYYGHFKEKKVDNEIVLVDIGYKNNEVNNMKKKSNQTNIDKPVNLSIKNQRQGKGRKKQGGLESQ